MTPAGEGAAPRDPVLPRDTLLPHYAVVGAGSWGLALALHLARSGRPVTVWARDAARAATLARTRRDEHFLPGRELPATVRVTADPADACGGADRIVLAVPAQSTRQVLGLLQGAIPSGAAIVLTAKGIEAGTLALQSEIAAGIFGESRALLALSGPSFAQEVARGDPTAVVLASAHGPLATAIQEELSSGALRLYTNTDLRGVQLAGALKNVYALAAGVSSGLGFGANTVAALVTRSLAEMRRLGTAAGGRPETFDGLAGLGDLVLTCTGELSRNRRMGEEIGRGRSTAEALRAVRQVVEGEETSRSAHALAGRHGVEMPIVHAVHAVLHEGLDPREAIAGLMSRPLRREESP